MTMSIWQATIVLEDAKHSDEAKRVLQAIRALVVYDADNPPRQIDGYEPRDAYQYGVKDFLHHIDEVLEPEKQAA